MYLPGLICTWLFNPDQFKIYCKLSLMGIRLINGSKQNVEIVPSVYAVPALCLRVKEPYNSPPLHSNILICLPARRAVCYQCYIWVPGSQSFLLEFKGEWVGERNMNRRMVFIVLSKTQPGIFHHCQSFLYLWANHPNILNETHIE